MTFDKVNFLTDVIPSNLFFVKNFVWRDCTATWAACFPYTKSFNIVNIDKFIFIKLCFWYQIYQFSKRITFLSEIACWDVVFSIQFLWSIDSALHFPFFLYIKHFNNVNICKVIVFFSFLEIVKKKMHVVLLFFK